ncbi:acid stress chaperone HdeA [Microbulbifer aestuariivivens]|uniref:Acid stress chaperone HdeA n=1 Tax=Microbulbifer aestuariivivens TaxID=1908308 RepID=A0ABP9WP41_9GAMM
MNGKTLLLTLAISSLVAVPAMADKHKHKGKDAEKWTCADFLAIDAEYQPKAVYWASAYDDAEYPEEGVLDIEGTEKVTPMIIAACEESPDASFWEKFKHEWHKVIKDMKKDAEKVKDKM